MEEYENEIWKPIEGYEGYYNLSSKGVIYGIKRKRYYFGNKLPDGYYNFRLSKPNCIKMVRINRLVYETFVGQIPKGYDVHHKDHNPKNNCVENLELIELHTHHLIHSKERYIPVSQYSKKGEHIADYKSLTDAEKQTKISIKLISECLNNKLKTAGGFIWVKLDKNNIEELLKNLAHKGKPVLQYTKDGQFVAEYKSAIEAERHTGINNGNITKCCRNFYGFKSAGGFVWKYKN